LKPDSTRTAPIAASLRLQTAIARTHTTITAVRKAVNHQADNGAIRAIPLKKAQIRTRELIFLLRMLVITAGHVSIMSKAPRKLARFLTFLKL